ncbi:MAG TPA: biopolymer transporter ExbD [Myxococcales bacterium LLY-WYZ-16_1]|nr:biopolymer transporter ExbD [Myxococcales bacterium LLY-WYZ-16_1]
MGGPGRNDQPNLDDPEVVEQGSFVEINIVPLVDIMLVLLVILMATSTDIIQAGLAEGTSFRVNLPTGSRSDQVQKLTDELLIAVLEDGSVILDGQDLSIDELRTQLEQAAARKPDRLVLVQADERAFHRRVVRVMETAREAGLANLAIATRPEQ